jgi:hypothetical protein
LVVELVPSSPKALDPQHFTAPAELTAHMWF